MTFLEYNGYVFRCMGVLGCLYLLRRMGVNLCFVHLDCVTVANIACKFFRGCETNLNCCILIGNVLLKKFETDFNDFVCQGKNKIKKLGVIISIL